MMTQMIHNIQEIKIIKTKRCEEVINSDSIVKMEIRLAVKDPYTKNKIRDEFIDLVFFGEPDQDIKLTVEE